MQQVIALVQTVLNLALVVVGFGLVIFIHELGHFIAARWAGTRVLAFALGFGPAVCSYRHGLGFRRGSSEREYLTIVRNGAPAGQHASGSRISPTEYRLNALPLGGYVKLLGQEDLNPGAESESADSYQNTPVWKRMIFVSGGVVMNLVTAALIFMGVFLIGLPTPPALVGAVVPGSPAARAVATNAGEAGVETPGLRAGDLVVSVNDRGPDDFSDVMLAGAMAAPGRPVSLLVSRQGVRVPLRFEVLPERSQFTGMLDLGVEPARSCRLTEAGSKRPEEWAKVAALYGLEGVAPGARLVRVDDRAGLALHEDAAAICRERGGVPLEFEFVSPLGATTVIEATPVAEMMVSDADADPGVVRYFTHVLGLTPVMRVGPLGPDAAGYKKGLREGDVFARVGSVEFPSIDSGVREIRSHARKALDVVVLRAEPGVAGVREVGLSIDVDPDGVVGFWPDDTSDESTLLSLPPAALAELSLGSPMEPAPASGVIHRAGTRVRSVSGVDVSNFTELRAALQESTRDAFERGVIGATVRLGLELPLPASADGQPVTEEVDLRIARDELDRLHALSWGMPFPGGLFDLEEQAIKATGPLDAVAKGVRRTHRMMMMTYVTLVRLAQGTVTIDNLKGPVGIAHLGTQIADEGLLKLVFFFGLISVNLAVINFLPLPIADGGQFLMLAYEQVRGRPLPLVVRNAITTAGVLLIGALFLFVTFNDVTNLFGG